AGLWPALLARLPGAAQFLHLAQPSGAADGGDGAGHSVQCAGRLQPDLRSFRPAAAWPDGCGPGERLVQPVHPGGDDGNRTGNALSAALSRSASFRAATLAIAGGNVSSG